MKKLLAAVAFFASTFAFGSHTDFVVVAGSKGPDKYADGTQALVGECYALVWSQDEFAGFNADGSFVNSNDLALVIVSRADENGACPLFGYAVSSEIMNKGGNISLWLLDTRRYSEDGSVKPYGIPGTVYQSVPAIAGAAKVEADIQIKEPGAKSIYDVAGEMTPTTVPNDVPAPVVDSIKVENGYAVLKVKNTVPFVNYNFKAGGSLTDLADDQAEHPVSGAATKTESITLIKKATGANEFFKVGPHSGKARKD